MIDGAINPSHLGALIIPGDFRNATSIDKVT